MKLNERKHDGWCATETYTTGGCDCHLSEIAQLKEENERLEQRWARHYRSLAEDVALAYDAKRERWREYVPETTADEIDSLLADTQESE